MPSAFAVQTPGIATLRALNYSPLLETFRGKRGKNTIRFGDILTANNTGYGTVFARRDCDLSLGVELLSQTDAFAAEPVGRIIRADSMPRPDRHRVKLWQILIAGVGTLAETELYGRAIIADDRLAGKHLSQDVLALTAAEPGSVSSLYIYAFLCTPMGVSLVRSTSYGTKMLRIRRSAISELCIPDADKNTKERVANLVRSAAEERGRYLSEIQSARSVIERLPEAQEALAQCNERKARCSVVSGPFITISARNHAALGTARDILHKHWNSKLVDLLEQNGIYNGPRFARTPCKKPYGINFLDQRDVFSIRAVSRRIVEPRISKRLLYVPSHALIVASHGQLSEGSLFGHVETAAFGLHQCGITQDILRVLPKPEYHDFLLAFLSSRLGFLLLKSTAIGTSIPMMHPGLLAAIPHPPLNPAVMAAVSKHVKAAINARATSETAENEAVRIIEEEVIPPWLV